MVARAVLLQEPDRLSRGFALGPRVLARREVLEAGGFLAPGLPFGETARIALKPGIPLAAGKAALASTVKIPEDRVRDRNDAAPGIGRLIDQLEYYLGFIGLASLAAGGLGVHGAVSAYLETRKPAIAALKALGAEGALVRNLYLLQVGALAALGVAIGLAAGAVAPPPDLNLGIPLRRRVLEQGRCDIHHARPQVSDEVPAQFLEAVVKTPGGRQHDADVRMVLKELLQQR